MYHHFDLAVWKCCVVSVYLSCRKLLPCGKQTCCFKFGMNDHSLIRQTKDYKTHLYKCRMLFEPERPSIERPPLSSSLSSNKPEVKPYLSKGKILFRSVMASSKCSHIFVKFSVVTWPGDREREDVSLSCSRTSTTQAMATNAALLP